MAIDAVSSSFFGRNDGARPCLALRCVTLARRIFKPRLLETIRFLNWLHNDLKNKMVSHKSRLFCQSTSVDCRKLYHRPPHYFFFIVGFHHVRQASYKYVRCSLIEFSHTLSWSCGIVFNPKTASLSLWSAYLMSALNMSTSLSMFRDSNEIICFIVSLFTSKKPLLLNTSSFFFNYLKHYLHYILY